MDDFLERSGWVDAARHPITPDWSPRRFTRLRRANGQSAVLIYMPQDYPGHSLDDFVRISGHLRGAGLSAPEIYADAPGYLLVEDFGDTPIDAPDIEQDGYAAAIDVLAALREHPAQLVSYADGYIFKKLALFSVDPAWMQAWEIAAQNLPPCPHVFSHMDYKAGNLHWLAARVGVRRIGLLDFQAAQNAPFTYDVVNLLEDARRNLAPDLKAAMRARFKAALPAAWQALFDDWYVYMSAQFHARVLGQIQSNEALLAELGPRLRGYLRDEMAHPALAPVQAWCAANKVTF